MLSTVRLFISLTVSFFILAAGVWAASTLSVQAAAEKSAAPAGLTLQVTDIRNDQGKIIVLVFDDATAFQSDDVNKAVAFQEVNAAQGTLEIAFADLTEGPYAISLFHDENGDYDFNMVGGYPLEGYGMSGASGPLDEPDFQKAAVTPGTVTIRVFYLDS